MLASGTELTAQVIREAQFREGWRGYSQAEVDDFLEQVAAGVDALHARNRELVGATVARPVVAAADDSVRRTLVLAQRAADLVVSEAKSVADKLVGDATEKSKTLVSEAKSVADKLVDDATEKSKTLVSEAEERVEQIVSSAQASATQVSEDAKIRAEQAHQEALAQIAMGHQTASAQADALRSEAESHGESVRAQAEQHATQARERALAEAAESLAASAAEHDQQQQRIRALQAHATTTHSAVRRLLQDQLRQLEALEPHGTDSRDAVAGEAGREAAEQERPQAMAVRSGDQAKSAIDMAESLGVVTVPFDVSTVDARSEVKPGAGLADAPAVIEPESATDVGFRSEKGWAQAAADGPDSLVARLRRAVADATDGPAAAPGLEAYVNMGEDPGAS